MRIDYSARDIDDENICKVYTNFTASFAVIPCNKLLNDYTVLV